MHDEDLHNFSSSHILLGRSEKAGRVGQCARNRNMRHEHRIFIRRPESTDHLKTCVGWQDIIKVNLKKIRWECVVWTDMAQDTDRWFRIAYDQDFNVFLTKTVKELQVILFQFMNFSLLLLLKLHELQFQNVRYGVLLCCLFHRNTV
jgi:hypothetical protein